MKVNKETKQCAVERIVDAYLENDIYEERVQFILRQYFCAEDNEQIQERLDEVERDVR